MADDPVAVRKTSEIQDEETPTMVVKKQKLVLLTPDEIMGHALRKLRFSDNDISFILSYFDDCEDVKACLEAMECESIEKLIDSMKGKWEKKNPGVKMLYPPTIPMVVEFITVLAYMIDVQLLTFDNFYKSSSVLEGYKAFRANVPRPTEALLHWMAQIEAECERYGGLDPGSLELLNFEDTPIMMMLFHVHYRIHDYDSLIESAPKMLEDTMVDEEERTWKEPKVGVICTSFTADQLGIVHGHIKVLENLKDKLPSYQDPLHCHVPDPFTAMHFSAEKGYAVPEDQMRPH